MRGPEEPHNQDLRKNDTASSTGTSQYRYQFRTAADSFFKSGLETNGSSQAHRISELSTVIADLHLEN